MSEKISEVGKALEQDAVFNGESLFVRGELSGYIELLDEMGIQRQFPKAKIATVKNAGHWLHAENPTEFYDIVINFL